MRHSLAYVLLTRKYDDPKYCATCGHIEHYHGGRRCHGPGHHCCDCRSFVPREEPQDLEEIIDEWLLEEWEAQCPGVTMDDDSLRFFRQVILDNFAEES